MQKPSFDTWTSIFLFASIQGLFVSTILFFIKKENRYANRLIATIIFLFSVTLFEYVLLWTHYIIYLPHLANVSSGFPFLFGPLLFFYFRYITDSKKISLRDWWHFVPFALFTWYISPFYFLSTTIKTKVLMGDAHPFVPDFWSHFATWSRVALLIGYCFFIHYSFWKKINFSKEVSKWYKYIMVFFVFFVLSFTSYYVLVNFSFFNNNWDYGISFAMSFFIFFMAWFGYLQPQVFNGFTIKESLLPSSKYKTSNLTPAASKSLIESANKLMTEKKVYEESELSLDKLSEMLGTTKHNLSQAINENTGLNFFEYINQFRIREAQRLLAETSKKEYNIIDIAYIVGFNNKVSFNNMFKKITGITPSEFRKNHGVLEEVE